MSEWEGETWGAQGREGQLALCLHAVPGCEARVCPGEGGGWGQRADCQLQVCELGKCRGCWTS